MFVELIDKVDIGIFGALIILNIIFWKKNISNCMTYGLVIFCLGFLFPLMSSGREVSRAVEANGGPFMDAFNLLYTYLAFPNYWIILFIQVLVLSFKPKPKLGSKKVVSADILDDNF